MRAFSGTLGSAVASAVHRGSGAGDRILSSGPSSVGFRSGSSSVGSGSGSSSISSSANWKSTLWGSRNDCIFFCVYKSENGIGVLVGGVFFFRLSCIFRISCSIRYLKGFHQILCLAIFLWHHRRLLLFHIQQIHKHL